MSGLVAVVSTARSRPVDQQEVERLADDYASLRGPALRQPFGDEQARGVVFRGVDDVAPTTSSPSWAAVSGVLRTSQPWHGAHEDALRGVDGHFALVSRDSRSGQVLVANDPMGMQPVHVAERGDRTYVSTSALVLARHLRPPASALGLRAFLLSGYHFGERTCWEGVRRLDPASCLVLGNGRRSEHRYWRPAVDHSITSLSLDAAAAHGLEVMRATFAEYLGGAEHCADLTGGFDSRLLCLVLDAAGVPFSTNTRSVRNRADMRLAEQIARRKGWEWYDASLPDDWALRVPDVLPLALAWGDAQLEVLQLARVLYAHQQLAPRWPRMLGGAGGEHFERNWESEFFNAGRSRSFNMARWIDMIALKASDADLLAGGGDDVKADFGERMSRWIEPYSDELNTTQLELMFAYKCTGHGGAYRAADGAAVSTQLPYYFRPVFSTAISTDPRHRNGHRLHRKMIDLLDRDVASMVTTHGGTALPTDQLAPHRRVPYWSVIARKTLVKVAGERLGRLVSTPPAPFAWQSAAHGAVLREHHAEGLLDPDRMRTAPLLRRDTLESLLRRALRPGFADDAMLGRVITAELALRRTDTDLD